MGQPDQARICAAIDGIRDKSEINLVDVLELAETSIQSMRTFFDTLDQNVYKEFRDIAAHIDRAKQEIGELGANELKETRLPMAGEELHAVISATEDATTRIMESAETILAADTDDAEAYQTVVQDNVMAIFEACSFQDITGQRISKVVETLEFIERRVTRFVDAAGIEDSGQLSDEEAADEARKRDLILNGPAKDGEGHDQSSVDALFDN